MTFGYKIHKCRYLQMTEILQIYIKYAEFPIGLMLIRIGLSILMLSWIRLRPDPDPDLNPRN
jgi:hypothetical protein